MSENQRLVAKCDHCPGVVQFAVWQAGQSGPCTFCHMDTVYRMAEPPPPEKITGPAKVGIAVCLGIVIVLSVIYGASVAGGVLAGLLLAAGLIAGAALYFLPSIIAHSNRHRNFAGVFIVNAIFGWTLIGWAGALVWAFISQERGPHRQ